MINFEFQASLLWLLITLLLKEGPIGIHQLVTGETAGTAFEAGKPWPHRTAAITSHVVSKKTLWAR